MTAADPRESLASVLASARERIRDLPPVRIGAVREPGRMRRLLGGSPVIAPVAEARHLGVLLVGGAGLWHVGEVLRAAEEVRRGYTADAQRVRAQLQGMAFRGGFGEGETCFLDPEPIDVDAVEAGGSSGPLSRDGGRVMVRWSPGGWLRPLADYLDERIELARAAL